ncbi:ABC transporter ATP-binding protein [Bifidobacterium vespertilionis]|uniref:ABC transporter ATP-binding protein n=1 Tax=Bifidobacterium vespertilionis TaxID=2562524 RepID=UPI001BDD0BFE|nr:ABC transporter ATP-binding protein [Bifidobacterium vespertilionis]MBT1179882.1 ABC transporter ATP-binding protein [Bifidobacterium vespertilionis]
MNADTQTAAKEDTDEASKPTTLRKAWRLNLRALGLYWRNRPGWFAAITISALFDAAFPYATIWLSARLIDELAGARDPDRLRMWVLLTLAVGLALGLASAAAKHWANAENGVVEPAGYQTIPDKLLTMDYPLVDDAHTADVTARIQQTDHFTGRGQRTALWIYQTSMPAVFRILGGAGLSVTLFTTPVPDSAGAGWLTVLNSPWLGAVAIGLIVAIVLASTLLAERGERYWDVLDKEGRFGNRVFRFFSYLYQDAKRALDLRIYRQYEEVALPFQKANEPWDLNGPFGRVLYRCMAPLLGAGAACASLITGVAYAFVCLKALGGAFGVGAVTQYVGAITTMFAGVSKLFEMGVQVKANGPFLRRLFDFLDTPNTMYQGSLTTEKRTDRQYDVEFRDVSFRYPGAPAGTWALRHVNLRFRIGGRLAVVGENGSGKTTFIKLLARLYDPTEGAILLNGIDIRKYQYDEYMRLFSVVFQDFRLLALPLGQNVAASAHYDPALVRDCLERADLADRLANLPEGLNTPLYRELDKHGMDVSGGEAQKIAIARALYRDAPFIVLDEPTAALDPVAEAAIYARFDRIATDRTAVYISHRLSSCRFCDEIAVFDHGRIVQTGTHDELVRETAGKYRQLWQAQAQYYRK